MNIIAIWRDPDSVYLNKRVTIVNTEWLYGRLQALVIDLNGYFKHVPINELQVIDESYLPSRET